MQNRWFLIGSIVLIVGGVFFMQRGGFPSETPLDAATIVLRSDGFHPRTVTVKKGGTVTFVNETDKGFWPASNLHPDHSIYSAFDPKEPVGPGESWSFTFENTGTWGFHDHVRSYFTGAVTVR